jgi:hypothetical protein
MTKHVLNSENPGRMPYCSFFFSRSPLYFALAEGKISKISKIIKFCYLKIAEIKKVI